MQITVKANSHNTKTILSLLEDMGITLPCNCHGRHHCNGRQYTFDCSLIPKETVTVSLPESGKALRGISLEDMTTVPGTGDTLLIDLGTTTVALALIDQASGALRQTQVFANPQKSYGADVISRIQASQQGKGENLQKLIISAIEEQVKLLCERNQQTTEDIDSCLIAGNTTMIHLLMGYDCSPLAASPFVIQEPSPEPFYYHSCEVRILPWFSAFVGGDIAAGMIACNMSAEKTSLLIDLGTNGEMLLHHQGTFFSTATAAGPAFEGNGLSCGCPGIPGAISGVQLKRLRPALSTIENKLPVGICGSGAISLCAELLRHSYVTKEGVLTSRFPENGLVLGVSAQGTPLHFTPDDFRNVQLSVAAVAAGIDTLTHTAGVAPEDIRRVFLGGGFGFYLDLQACQTLGMFSTLPLSSIHPMGNTCLRGLYSCAMAEDTLHSLPSVQSVSLADSAYFQKQFLHHMTYPD